MAVKEELLALLLDAGEEAVSGEEIAGKLKVTRSAVWKAIKKLKEEGYQIEGVSGKGYWIVKESDRLSRAGIEKYLTDYKQEFAIQVYQELPSTNQRLKELADENAPEGTVLLAEAQTMGRGRQGRKFFSPPETGIYMSILLRPTFPLADTVLVTTAAAAAAALGVEEIVGKPVQIKWVNDLWMDGKKICGILTEASMAVETGNVDYVVVGIGINVYPPENEFPEELKDSASFIWGGEQRQIRNRLAARILDYFWGYYKNLDQKEFFQEYKKRSLVLGKKIQILGREAKGESPVSATAVFLDDRLRLVVEYEDGNTEHLSGGEIRVIV